MPPKSARWATPRKKRKQETKPRKPRAQETKPRKKRVSMLEPIAARGDLEGLAQQRRRVSKVKLSSRLMELNNAQLKRYASHAGIALRTARLDRGPGKLRPGCNSAAHRAAVANLWVQMVEDCGVWPDAEPYGHKECTIAHLREQARELFGVEMSMSQAQRIASGTGVKKPVSFLKPPNNEPEKTKKNRNRV